MTDPVQSGLVECVAMRRGHHFSKTPALEIELVAGLGVRGDGHFGETVQHRFDKRRAPSAANLRQVHLIAQETLDGARASGFDVAPGDLGENVTTRGLDLLALPQRSTLAIGEAVIEVTGVREPCVQMNRFRDGLMAHFIRTGDDGRPTFTCGVMGVIIRSGSIRPGDTVSVRLPAPPYRRLTRV